MSANFVQVVTLVAMAFFFNECSGKHTIYSTHYKKISLCKGDHNTEDAKLSCSKTLGSNFTGECRQTYMYFENGPYLQDVVLCRETGPDKDWHSCVTWDPTTLTDDPKTWVTSTAAKSFVYNPEDPNETRKMLVWIHDPKKGCVQTEEEGSRAAPYTYELYPGASKAGSSSDMPIIGGN